MRGIAAARRTPSVDPVHDGVEPAAPARHAVRLAVLALAGLAGACGGSRLEAAPSDRPPSLEVTPITSDALCITHGEVAGIEINDPTVRGYARGAGGDAAELTFTYRGESFDTRKLAGGQARRQLGLKLRAKDSCNVVYVMWRLDPRPLLDVSVKANPLATTHEQCGAGGYTKVKPYRKTFVPAFTYGTTHTLRAEIVGDELFAWIDGTLLWQGRLPDAARAIAGPAGIRSDNVRFDLVALATQPGTPAATAPACKREGGS